MNSLLKRGRFTVWLRLLCEVPSLIDRREMDVILISDSTP